MLFPRARLVVAACLFVGWLGVLLYLVVQNQQMIVLARPQFLAAPVCVIGVLRDNAGQPSTQVAVDSVVWTEGPQVPERIEVKALTTLGANEGYTGPGKYLLALKPTGANEPPRYELVPVPSYPARRLSIYPWTPVVERQLDEIKKLRGL